MAARGRAYGLAFVLLAAALTLLSRSFSQEAPAFAGSSSLRATARAAGVVRRAEASAGTMAKVADVVAEQLDVDKDKFTKTSTLTELGADSLDIVECVMALEEGFDVELPDEETTTLKNVGNVMDLIESKL